MYSSIWRDVRDSYTAGRTRRDAPGCWVRQGEHRAGGDDLSELQRAAIEDYCRRRGYILDEVIEDLDATGRNFTRKGVQKAIERVETAGVAVVVVWKFSRFGRNRKGWAINLDRVESAGGRLESATEEVDASTSTGRFTRGMLSEVAAWESERIGEGWQEAHARRRGGGLPHNGGARFGYIYHRTTVGEKACPQGCGPGECATGYLVDPELGPVTAEMYGRYNRGESQRGLAIWLNSRGITTRLGRPWTDRSVRRFLDTGFAAGKLRIHDRACRCKTPQACERNTYLPGAHAAIIEGKVWEAYLRNRKRRAKLPPRVESPVYPLTGLVACGRCGGPLNVHGIQHRRVYKRGYMYQCSRYHRARLCPGTWISRPRLEQTILDWIGEVAAADIDARAAVTTARTAARATLAADRRRLLREGQRLARALTQLTVDRASGLVPETAYADARDELLTQQATVSKALAGLADDADRLVDPPIPVARKLTKRWSTLPAGARRALLSKLVTKVTVTSHGKGVVDVALVTTWGEEVVL